MGACEAKRKHGAERRHSAKQSNARQCEAKQGNARQCETKQGKARTPKQNEGKRRKAWEGVGKRGKPKQKTTRHGKDRPNRASTMCPPMNYTELTCGNMDISRGMSTVSTSSIDCIAYEHTRRVGGGQETKS